MKEALMSINKYNKPKILKDEDSTCLLLLRLLLLTPGSIQSHPKMGVGIISKWRYSDMEQLSELEVEIERQISTYLPMLLSSKVEIFPNKEKEGEIIINISTNNVVYSFESDNNELRLVDL